MKVIYYIILVFLSVSCAQQSGLSGGNKDTTPPQVEEDKTIPENNATNFNATKIEIGFNEFIRLEKPNQNIIITPSATEQPTYEVKGKKIVVTLKNKLDENTTYIINFGNSISDITEGNRLGNFNYVFSTGSEIDSLTLNGSVYNAFTKEPEKEILVGLYKSAIDSIAINEQPYYFNPTKQDGSFAFKNLKKGKYTLVAIDDKNNDLKYNPYTDAVAFLDSSITIKYDSATQPINLSLFTEAKGKNRVTEKKYTHPGKVTLILEEKTTEVKVDLVNNLFADNTKNKKFVNTDSITFWVNEVDSIPELKIITEFENQEADTTFLKIRKPKVFKDTILKFKTNTTNDLSFFDPVKIEFNAPINSVDKNLIKLMGEDSIELEFSIEKENNIVSISSQLKEDVDYQITVFPMAFKDLYNRTNDTINLFFKTIPPNQYGNLILHYEKQNKNEQHLIQLIKEGLIINEKIVSSSSETIEYKNLSPGNYLLKTIEDKNNNGKWDTGDYLLKKQPELVKLFEDKIDLKGGWDLDLTWKN